MSVSDWQAVVRRDGTETDITEGVEALYDLVLDSMDWGSGFLSADDAEPVAVVARACGFEGLGEVESYIKAKKHEAEAAAFYSKTIPPSWPRQHAVQTKHDHVYSSVGRCMWPACPEGRER